MHNIATIFRREFASYFATPLAFVFIVIFLILVGVFAFYIGSFLMAGGFLAIGSCVSAATRNLVIAFIFTVVVCFLLLLAGFAIVLERFQGWAPQPIVDAIASLSFLTHFNSISKGVIDFRDLLYFGTLIAAWLIATAIVLELKKAD